MTAGKSLVGFLLLSLGLGLIIFLVWAAAVNKNEWPAESVSVLKVSTETTVEKTTPTKETADNKTETKATAETPAKKSTMPLFVDWQVPFTAQAPRADWSDARQQDGCEEASVLMAVKWARGETMGSSKEAEKEIVAIADWEIANYSSATDTDAADTAERLLKKYFQYDNWTVKSLTEADDIIKELKAGQVVILPTNGQKLANPFYTQPGPLTHMIVIKGYDEASDEFITNDPGTKRGAGYRYKTSIIINAAWDYATGDHEAGDASRKNMIVIYKYGQKK